MLKPAKSILLNFAKSAGGLGAFAESRWRNRKILILGYHGVSLADEHIWDPSLFVTPEFLARRFQLIKANHCNVLPLQEAVSRLYDGTLPERAVVITFDDGFYNFYGSALPIIEEFGFPVTLYLTTFYSGYNRPIFGVAANYLLWRARSRKIGFKDIPGMDEGDAVFDLSIGSEREGFHSRLVELALKRNLSAESKNEILVSLCTALGIDFDAFCRDRTFQLVDASEVESLARRGVDVQLHTHRHRVPTDEKLFAAEIEENRTHIEKLTKKPALHFCYPDGIYDDRFPARLRSAGVRSAVTTEPGLASPASNPYRLPRMVDSTFLSEVEFEGWLSGFSHLLPTRASLGI